MFSSRQAAGGAAVGVLPAAAFFFCAVSASPSSPTAQRIQRRSDVESNGAATSIHRRIVS
jgi:hypothetical protein